MDLIQNENYAADSCAISPTAFLLLAEDCQTDLVPHVKIGNMNITMMRISIDLF